MAIQTQGNRRYYYRAVRVDGKPRRIYVAAGREAEEHARRDAQERQQRLAQISKWTAVESQVVAAEAVLTEVAAWTSMLAAAVLILSGHRQHRGTWRRRVFK